MPDTTAALSHRQMIRLSGADLQRIDEMAVQEDRTRSAMIRRLMDEAMVARAAKAKANAKRRAARSRRGG